MLLIFSFFFTCEFIRHNAFVSSWFFISWLGVQTQPAPNLWRISRSVAVVVNAYSSETVEFSPNFAFRRTVKACRSYFWRLSYIQKEENPKTVGKNNTQQFFVTKTEGELSFGKYWINFLHKAVRIANSYFNKWTRVCVLLGCWGSQILEFPSVTVSTSSEAESMSCVRNSLLSLGGTQNKDSIKVSFIGKDVL